MNKRTYEKPELSYLEIKVEHGFAESTDYDTWNDTDKGTGDAGIGYGDTDDEWA